jgi:type III pantothenate kinase
MLLAVDIGNAEIDLGVYGEGGWRARFRVYTSVRKTTDDYRALFLGLLSGEGLDPGDLERAVVGSVVPPLTHVLRELLSSLSRPPLVVGPGVRTGLDLRVDHPSEVGADLVANAVAAYERFNTACIAVDFGTATTFTAVVPPGGLVGVAITPGISTAAEALTEHAALLPKVSLEPPSRALGKNTQEAMQSGIIFGYVGLVKELIGRLRDELGGEARVIGTGGHAPLIASLTDAVETVDPWLTLDGLRLIAARNP